MPREKTNDAWTEYDAPWVEETDIPFTYRVESRSDKDFAFHTVDLTQRGGHGACTCRFFTIRAASNFRRHFRHIPYAPKREGVSECVHIRAALDHYHQHVTIPMLANFRHGIPTNNQ
jgi:hypothetical protein